MEAVPFGEDDPKRLTKTFLVRADDAGQGPKEILAAPKLPRILSDLWEPVNREIHRVIPICTSLTAEQQSPTQWIVTAQYENMAL